MIGNMIHRQSHRLPPGFMVCLGELCYRGWRIGYHMPKKFFRAHKRGVSISARDLFLLKRVLDERREMG